MADRVGKKFYLQDWRNADRFKPNATPPRQKFAGFVEFNFNPAFIGKSTIGDSTAYRTQISGLVQSAKIPEISFNTVTKKQYNYRRVIQTGVEYGPCNITVVDTVNNEWLQLFMKYFAYHYNEPRNRTSAGTGDERDKSNEGQFPSNKDVTTNPSTFMTSSFDSNGAGLNISNDAHFIESIRIINYAGGKGVEYILSRPQITNFNPGDVDVTDSAFRTFDIEFAIENMTVNQKFNFKLDDVDLARFDSRQIEFPDNLGENSKEFPAYQTRNQDFMGTPTDRVERFPQNVKQTAMTDAEAAKMVDTYNDNQVSLDGKFGGGGSA